MTRTAGLVLAISVILAIPVAFYRPIYIPE